eukprot:9444664-Pyramimonas_sp.AAC.1
MAQIRELVELPLRHPQLFKTIGALASNALSRFGLLSHLPNKYADRTASIRGLQSQLLRAPPLSSLQRAISVHLTRRKARAQRTGNCRASL